MARIGVVGGGAMATAIIAGAIDRGVRRPADWVVADPDPDRRADLADRGVDTVDRASAFATLLDPGDPILLAVKPQMLDAAAADLAETPMEGRVVTSILAGATSERIRTALGGAPAVVRVMPNTPARVGLGATAIALGAGSSRGDEAMAVELFGALGRVFVIDEPLMDAFTAVAGSGPAYVFYLAEAMARAGEELGLDPADAATIAAQTVLGAATLLSEGPAGAAELRRRVTSPGGTTAAAIESMDASRVSDSLIRAMRAARDRGRALGAGG